MADIGVSRVGKTVLGLCNLRTKSRLLYTHGKVCGCVLSQRRYLSARYTLHCRLFCDSAWYSDPNQDRLTDVTLTVTVGLTPSP